MKSVSFYVPLMILIKQMPMLQETITAGLGERTTTSRFLFFRSTFPIFAAWDVTVTD
jgi:hypothetical protein